MKRLKGKNQIREFSKVAKALTSKIGSHKGVAGVILIGGLTRGFADKYSDVDMITLLSRKDENLRKKLKEIGSDEQKRSGIDIDLEVHFLEDFRARKWDEMFKWELKVSKVFWLKRIVICSEYLKWYCCPPKEHMGTMVEAWVERGDMVSAQYCLSYAFDLLIRIMFALNKEFLPAPKWRVFYSYTLRWLPTDYKKLLKKALTIMGFSKHDLNRRMKALKQIWRETLPKIREETGLTPDLISKYYVEKVLHQTQAN
jgi:predicted nucleotidyltransferase